MEKQMLQWTLEQFERSKFLEKVVMALSLKFEDDTVEKFCLAQKNICKSLCPKG